MLGKTFKIIEYNKSTLCPLFRSRALHLQVPCLPLYKHQLTAKHAPQHHSPCSLCCFQQGTSKGREILKLIMNIYSALPKPLSKELRPISSHTLLPGYWRDLYQVSDSQMKQQPDVLVIPQLASYKSQTFCPSHDTEYWGTGRRNNQLHKAKVVWLNQHQLNLLSQYFI